MQANAVLPHRLKHKNPAAIYAIANLHCIAKRNFNPIEKM
jgi:hypothetical protein